MDIRKINGNELHGTKTGDGWEKCSDPISNDEVWAKHDIDRAIAQIDRAIVQIDRAIAQLEWDSDHPEPCQACGYPFGKIVIGRLDNKQYLECRYCRALFIRPVHLGIVMTKMEMQIND